MEDKVTKKKLKSLQRKWIDSVSDKDKEEGPLTMDFSEIKEEKEKGGKAKKKSRASEMLHSSEPSSKKKKVDVKEAPAEESPLPDIPIGEEGVDYEMIDEMVRRAVNIEVERAIREIKAEIREQSDIGKKELFEQLKLEIETLRQEIEFSRPAKRSKGLFERF